MSPPIRSVRLSRDRSTRLRAAGATLFKENRKIREEAEDHDAKLKEKEAEYIDKFANPYGAAARGFIDEVIMPDETRTKLIRGFKMLENKVASMPKRKHGNIPL